jgi:hypothetical protein
MRNWQSGPRNGREQPQWHIVTEVPLPPAAPEPVSAAASAEQPLEGEFRPLDDDAAPEPGANGAPRSAPRVATQAAILWHELDALMRLPQPPVAPANTVFTERYIRRSRRRALWRRLRRLAFAALIGVLLGIAAWVWAPLGWLHPLGPPVALPRLGLAAPGSVSHVLPADVPR